MWPGIYPRVYHSLTLMFNFGYYCRELNISLKKKIRGNTHLFHASRGRHLTFKPKLYSNYVIVQRTVITEITGRQTNNEGSLSSRTFLWRGMQSAYWEWNSTAYIHTGSTLKNLLVFTSGNLELFSPLTVKRTLKGNRVKNVNFSGANQFCSDHVLFVTLHLKHWSTC